MDVGLETEELLKREGYNVTTGSFGSPYKVQERAEVEPIITNGELPVFYTEKEIVVIDLSHSELKNHPNEKQEPPSGENDLWINCSKGFVDPRPRLMAYAQKHFDRIFEHGGIFVIFAEPKINQDIIWGHLNYSRLVREGDLQYSNWSFLSILDSQYFTTVRDQGMQISLDGESYVGQTLSDFTQRAFFNCTLDFRSRPGNKEMWLPIAKNKFGATVAGLKTVFKEGVNYGWILILPHIIEKAEFLAKLFKEVLPELSPEFFPQIEGKRWVQRTEYELPSIVELNNKIGQVEERGKIEVDELNNLIQEERETIGFLHDLLTSTGDTLVESVEKTLKLIGFESVVNIDEKIKAQGDATQLREDLQIHDESPVILVEIKGISSMPSDDDALQVQKYLPLFMKETKSTEVRGLTIINHQKHVPAIERNNKNIFRDEIITNVQKHDIGLLTTWDLYKLARGFIKNGWKSENIKPLLYENGRIHPIPENYELIGTIENFWENVGAISISLEDELRHGDRISFELPVDYEEQIVDSIHLNDAQVESAEEGTLVGIKTTLGKDQAKKGVRVFRVLE